MKIIYSVKVRFVTVAPLYTERTYFVADKADVDLLIDGAAQSGAYRIMGFSVQHIMKPGEVVADIAKEATEARRAVGEA